MKRADAAALLKVTEATLERWVRQGLIRSLDRAGLTFDGAELARWARERGMQTDPESSARQDLADVALVSAIERGAVTVGVEASSAMDAIEVAIDALSQLTAGLRERIREEVLERERMASTALGRGIAIPHPREPLGDALDAPLVSIVLLDRPLDWASVDGEPVHAVTLVVAQSAGVHLEILSQIGRAVRSAKLADLLRSRPGKSALLDGLRATMEKWT